MILINIEKYRKKSQKKIDIKKTHKCAKLVQQTTTLTKTSLDWLKTQTDSQCVVRGELPLSSPLFNTQAQKSHTQLHNTLTQRLQAETQTDFSCSKTIYLRTYV